MAVKRSYFLECASFSQTSVKNESRRIFIFKALTGSLALASYGIPGLNREDFNRTCVLLAST
jgi:hypothetical protein